MPQSRLPCPSLPCHSRTAMPLHVNTAQAYNILASLPGKSAGQVCRSLPGKSAGQVCRASLPGKSCGILHILEGKNEFLIEGMLDVFPEIENMCLMFTQYNVSFTVKTINLFVDMFLDTWIKICIGTPIESRIWV
jgi:hypothetical protein